MNHPVPLLTVLTAGSKETVLVALVPPERLKNDNSARDEFPLMTALKDEAHQTRETTDAYFPYMMDVIRLMTELMDAYFPYVVLMISHRPLEFPLDSYLDDEELRLSQSQSLQDGAREMVEMMARPTQETLTLSAAYQPLEGGQGCAQAQANDVYQVVWYQYPGWLV